MQIQFAAVTDALLQKRQKGPLNSASQRLSGIKFLSEMASLPLRRSEKEGARQIAEQKWMRCANGAIEFEGKVTRVIHGGVWMKSRGERKIEPGARPPIERIGSLLP